MMKTYEGKTEDEVVQTACLDLGVTPDQLTYEVIEEKKGLFSKKVVIECYTQSMIQEYLENFVRKTLSNMEFTVETVTYVQDGRIYCNVNTDNNSILMTNGITNYHCMIITGVNIIDNKIDKWKIENSWGSKTGNNGYYVATDDFINNYVHRIAINKKYLSEKQLQILSKDKILVSKWDAKM